MKIPPRPGRMVTVLLAILLALTAAAAAWLALLGSALLASAIGLAGLVAAAAIGAASAQANAAERQLAELGEFASRRPQSPRQWPPQSHLQPQSPARSQPQSASPSQPQSPPEPRYLAEVTPEPESRPPVPLREARPGEVPAPYLDAVLKGAQATQAGYRARARQL